ncbi:MAG TPA: hypothetical protein VGK67_29475 [Myxococcales bacterium]|jgi:hypothetical protein
MTSARHLVVLAAALLALAPATTGCKSRQAAQATPARPLAVSKWEGTMTYRGSPYAFRLAIDEVNADGAFGGELVWDYHGMRSPIRGKADGNHLVFVDSDRDTKDVRISGSTMEGTDKNGSATFVARRVDVPAARPPPPPPADQQQQQQQQEQQQQQQGQQQQ